MNYAHSIVICLFMLIANPATAQYSGEPIDLRSIVHIARSDGSTGTGFVVATRGNRSEIWTNGHVAGSAGKAVTITQGWGTSHQKRTSGIVVESTVEGDYDRAKILTQGAVVCTPLPIALGNDRIGDWHHGGHPKGGTFWLAAIRDKGDAFGQVRGFSPPSIPGQSGSPVIKKGKVVGVTTFRFNAGGESQGGWIPISQFTNEVTGRRVSSTSIPAGWERLN